MTRSFHIVAATLAVGLFAGLADAAMFTAGNLAVYRTGVAGDGTNPSTAPDRVFVDEYDAISGGLVQSIPMPISAASATSRAFTAQGDAGLEGLIKRSTDGRFLVLTGYDYTIGSPLVGTLAQSNANAINRTLGRIDVSGTVDTSTTITYNGEGSPRSVISDDGSNLWIATGSVSGDTDGGVRYTPFGTAAATPTLVSVGTTDPRSVGIFQGQLYGSTQGPAAGIAANSAVFSVGTGTPTTSGQTNTGLPGVAGAGAQNVIDFFLADLNGTVPGVDTLFVTGDAAAALTKYSLVSGTWVSNGTIGVNADDYVGLTAAVDSILGVPTVTLYATRRNGANADTLVRVIDPSGYNSGAGVFGALLPTTLATAQANTLFKGVAFVPSIPEPASLGMLASCAVGLLLHRRARRS